MKPILCGLFAAFLLTACRAPEEGETTVSAPDPGTERTSMPAWIIKGIPENAMGVIEAREALKPGDSARIGGQIGGVVEPFFSAFAGFVLADPSLVFCDEMGDDGHCPTPWDACCEDPDKVKASRITVQFVDSSGMPVDGGIRGVGGIREGDTVVVEGVVAATSTPENLILEAAVLYY